MQAWRSAKIYLLQLPDVEHLQEAFLVTEDASDIVIQEKARFPAARLDAIRNYEDSQFSHVLCYLPPAITP